MRLRRKRVTLPVSLLGAAALVLASCAPEDEEPVDEPVEEEEEEVVDEEEEVVDEDEEAVEPGEVEFGFIPWDEAIAVTNLWHHILEEEGYEVTQTQLEVGGLYAGLAQGDLDVFVDAWLPATHADYWEEFGDDIEELGVWFDEAPLTWTVPEYVDIDSIADLQGNADTFDGQIIGIEPGAGLTRISLEEVIPTYELGDEYELVEGSTPAMLTALEEAIRDEEPIVVTLWHPHWAYGEWDLKDLEDPENALGDPDEIRMVARDGFSADNPQVAEWLGNFEFPLDELSELQVMINEMDDELEAAAAWAEENPDRIDEWLGR